MKEIKLKSKTLERVNQLDASINDLNGQKNNIFLTLLESEGVDIINSDVSYEKGVITITKKK